MNKNIILFLYVLFFVYPLSFAQIKIDTSRIIEIQTEVENIRIDSMIYLCYASKYSSYSRELMTIEIQYFSDSIRNHIYLPMIELCDRLRVRIDSSLFESEKYMQKFQRIHIRKNDTIFGLMILFENNSVSVMFCDTNIHLCNRWWLQVSDCNSFIEINYFNKIHSSKTFKKIKGICFADCEMRPDWGKSMYFSDTERIKLFIQKKIHKKVLKKYLQYSNSELKSQND